jgi:hypothetical protein
MYRFASLAVLLSLAVAAPAPAQPTSARTDSSTAAVAAKKTERRKPAPRRGGKVRKAWPARKSGRPTNAMARWLAKQVGPVPRKHRAASRNLTQFSTRAAAVTANQPGVPFSGAVLAEPLSLVRSYEIPDSDPSAERLANLSWTYNSALAATAFARAGLVTQARQLLDQLAALQRTDGSIDFAYNTRTGQSLPLFRSGTVAWVGLAATAYRDRFCSGNYDNVALSAARWLLARQVDNAASPGNGLLAGGPDVTWSSTQHNLLARSLFVALADSLDDNCKAIKGSSDERKFAASLRAAAARIDTAVDRALLVRPAAGQAYFRQGVGDDARPVDTQALGILWLLDRGRTADAAAVRAYTDATMAVSDRSISLSSDPLSFNGTYKAAGPFVGYRPYADPTAPDVLWMEGTLQMRAAKQRLGLDTRALDASILAWRTVSGPGVGPLQADRTVTGNVFNEYHPWPDAAAAAWTLLSADPGFRLLG